MPTVTVAGCRLNYRWDGPEGAPVLLMSNSLGTSLAMWDDQIEALAERFRVLRYDSRGHGASEAPTGDYTIERLGRDALGLLDGLGVPSARMVGLSMGGMVGMWLAIHAPDRIERLALCNTSAHMPPPESWQGRIDLVRKSGMAAVADAVVERWFTPGFRSADPAAAERIRTMLLTNSAEGYAGCCAAIRDMDQRASVSSIRAPTLVIGGTEDPATPPAHAEFLAAAILGARLTMLQAAHLSNVERPVEFTAALIGFLEG